MGNSLNLGTSQGGLPFWEIVESEDCGFESRACRFETWSSQTEDLKIDICCFLAWRLVLLG